MFHRARFPVQTTDHPPSRASAPRLRKQPPRRVTPRRRIFITAPLHTRLGRVARSVDGGSRCPTSTLFENSTLRLLQLPAHAYRARLTPSTQTSPTPSTS
ncbi:hypothetical protein Q5752_003933 [Cryptotrichosporon argae]